MDLPSQLHAIWCEINHMIFRQAQRINRRYCLPTDTNRPLLDADRDFFSKYGGGKSQRVYLFFLHINSLSFSARIKVPVIAIFTKFDGLITMAFNELRKKQSIKEAKNRKFEVAESTLKTDFIDPLMAMICGPKDYVQLDGKPSAMNRNIIIYF